MEVTVIKAGLSYGAGARGSENGPDVLEQQGVVSCIEALGNNVDVVGVRQGEYDEGLQFKDLSTVRWAGEIVDVTNRIYEYAGQAADAGRFPLLIGGDDAASLGTLKASINRYGHLSIVWLGAFPDLNTYETTPSANYHGMVLSSIMGLGDSRFHENLFRLANPRDILLAGLRSLDPGEKEIIASRKITTIGADALRGAGEIPAAEITARFASHFKKRRTEHIHLCICLDVLDPEYAPAVNDPVPGGLSPEDLYGIVRYIKGTGMLRGADILGYNPAAGGGPTVASVLSLIYALWG